MARRNRRSTSKRGYTYTHPWRQGEIYQGVVSPVTHTPWPTSEWSEIIPGLYQGGHAYKLNGFAFSTKLKGIDLFDVVFSLYVDDHDEDSFPDPQVEHIIWEIWDDYTGVRKSQEHQLWDYVDQLVERLRDGKVCLIRCHAGYNRSGLVTALVLLRLGYTARAAIDLIRSKRSPYALCNPGFERFIIEHEDLYRSVEEPTDAH